MTMPPAFDCIIIIGFGSSGCVLAGRLREHPATRCCEKVGLADRSVRPEIVTNYLASYRLKANACHKKSYEISVRPCCLACAASLAS